MLSSRLRRAGICRLPLGPVPHPTAPRSASLARATFISQLIAERYRLPPQRERRRATMDVAVDAYAETEESAVRRMPPGYRKNLLA